ncbi:MAG: peroxiredoxin [Hyphomicrobium sp.]|uniref:peroxiredoxin n=1 Tax=Hyphomicrobium sp. TaxID=82 RepID=UPI0013239247|nr:peroxiredoxin [Hyphomicrobium sp.]KAB2942834.1 MAG: peroxiredoxin [Hyphomicrobium sp.]MBZ0211905.1 peroxiredoxin [Hyphomicrobium sp.]
MTTDGTQTAQRDAAARHLVPGLALPDVALPSSRGGTVNLSTRKGASVVYIYPWTGRPGFTDPPGWDAIPGAHGSTPETEGFRDHYLKFRAQRIEVFGLSGQPGEHHRELIDRLAVPFPLLSDEHLKFKAALDLPTFEAGGVTYLERLTLLVRDGRITHTFYPVERPATHAREVLDWLDEKRRAIAKS